MEEKRRKGQFYTPTAFADYAHRYMEDVFGADWKDKYVVWDCCCGSNNLTRDYYFKELYCSTLENAELEIGARYNQEATKFQFDFLNDEENKLPQNLVNAFKENKPIIFFINPPYAAATNMGTNSGSKEGCAKTKTNEIMLKNDIGACSQNLYPQFLYRIMMFKEKYNLTNINIGVFCPALFLSGSSYKNFRKVFLNEFAFNKAFQFNAGHFSNVSARWGISFSVWNSGVTADKENFKYDIVDIVDECIDKIQDKIIYNLDNITTASDWCKESIKGIKTFDAPQLSSGIVCKEKGVGKLAADALGYYVNVGNNVYKSMTDVYFVSSCSSMAHGISILPQNFDRVCANFTARKLIIGDWINDKDEYLAPNEVHEKYSEFENDSIVYSLFHSSSNQSSLRQIDYKGKKWDIKNEFFFMPKDLIMEMANENGFDFTYNDARVSSDRYVFNKLTEIELSKEAKAVLDKATDLVIKSFKYRALFNDENPQYQIMNWDCGWYQIKAMLKEYMPNDLKEFNELYKALADKMRPMVYELGFLK